MATKKEMEFCFRLIKEFCKETIEKKETAKEGTIIRQWEELYNEGAKCIAEIITEKINKMEKGEYK